MILELLWPEVCPFCGKVYRKGICPACVGKLRKLRVVQPICLKCGKPIRMNEQEYCYDCIHTEYYFDRGRALWIHKPPVSNSLYQFKYHNQRVFGRYYAEELYKQFSNLICEWNPNLIIPIPLHLKRRKKRGYNQSAIIAKELGKLCQIPVCEKLLKRIRYTSPQKKLDHMARWKNIQNAFAVTKEVQGIQSVLLVDDIYTTGNTINEAARKLKKAGIEKVYFLSVSIGQGY